MAGLKVITPPAGLPVTRAEIKTQLQIEQSDTIYDNQLDALLPAAVEWCEKYQNRAFMTQTLEIALDGWPWGCYIELPRPPLQSVTSVTFGADGDIWAPDNYIVDTYALVGRLVCFSGWPPGKLPLANGVRIRYVAGYGAAADVPLTTKQAIILLCLHWFNNGVCDPPAAVYSLLNLERVVPV